MERRDADLREDLASPRMAVAVLLMRVPVVDVGTNRRPLGREDT